MYLNRYAPSQLRKRVEMTNKAKAMRLAQTLLEGLRQGTYESGYRFDCDRALLDETLRIAGITLDHFGSSEEELKRLRVKACENEVELHVALLSSGSLIAAAQYYWHRCQLDLALAGAGLTLKRLGTSAATLDRLMLEPAA